MAVKRFRTKPVEIEAIQFTGGDKNFGDIREFCGGRMDDKWFMPNFMLTQDIWEDRQIVAQVWDKLHSTWVGVKLNQWIIKGQKGEFYPCDPETFAWKYEEVYTGDKMTEVMRQYPWEDK